MQHNKISCSVYRFHNSVAIYVGSGETGYLSHEQATKLGRALQYAALDISKGVKFIDSKIPTVEIDQCSGIT